MGIQAAAKAPAKGLAKSLDRKDLTGPALRTFFRIAEDDGVSKIEYVGDVGEAVPFGTPKWRGTFSMTYDQGPLSADARVRYVGGGKWNHLLDIENNDISARAYLDLGARVKIDNLTLAVSVNNVFDRGPPLTTTGQIHYDQIGRYFSTTAKLKF